MNFAQQRWDNNFIFQNFAVIFAARKSGKMPEWSNGAVSKTVELLVGSGGSNPPLSAERPRRYQRRGLSAERGGWPTRSAMFYPHPNLPLGEGLVASLRIRISAFFFIFCKARRRRAGMCDRREQIPPKRGMADKVGMVLPPTKPSPRRRLSRFAPRGQCSGVSAEFFNLPAALPFSLHNGSRFRISLPLWNFFSAVSLLWVSWTALPPQSPSTTAPIPAFPCRCGKNRRAHLRKVS